MEIPVYVVTGNLDSGKTTFLNNLFDKRKVKALVIQFEDGEEDLICGYTGYRKLMIPRRLLDQQQEQYEGYTITMTGYVLKDTKAYGENEFAVARLAMTCCVADLAPAGILCDYSQVKSLKEDSWITVEGTLNLNYDDYDGHKYADPLIMVTKITPAEKVEGYVYPY
ncbi:TIGR03943 family protein [Clostridium boliviensis]|uniref:TIGR03943 family protein n=1 Tax=Clostridium boliviensis TaxID=318465 RepID=A0ABU4GK86_9CLOT|nr:TIGR03943 family protein [Clostridium boliviensis]MDW2798023.1 TIGR03943 family protein [Clostridium boliviensis]